MNLLSEEEAMVKLLLYVRRVYGTQKRAAAAWGVSQNYVTGMMRGTKNISGKAAEELGLRRVTAYEVASAQAAGSTQRGAMTGDCGVNGLVSGPER